MILATHGIVGSQIVQATGLLAEYPGAAAAYSLRQLTTAYTADVIEVRRASDNATQDIGFVDGELDVTSLESFCSGTNGFVTTWYDQSCNGNDATQSTDANQPQIVSSGSVITENGKPAISKNSSFLYIPLSLNNNARFKSFHVLKTNANYHVLLGSNSTADGILFAQNTSNTTIIANATNNQLRKNAITFSPTTRRDIFNALSSQSLLYDDTNFNFVGSSFGTGFGGGGSGFGFYQLQEMIIYPSTNTEITGIETNINDFYSIYP